ncbi:MAG: hypothetical protein MUF25_27350 [Pirellulaceae bacterium]|nr:hypothetical protein [Pirellulaceae bacterium]
MRLAHKTRTRTVLSAAVLSCVSLISPVRGAAPETQETAAAGPASKPAVCQLQIAGGAIERLVLADESQKTTEFARPGESVSLPAGRYFVREVELTNGFRCYAWIGGDEDWIQVSADPAPAVKVGAPLTPKVRVKRAGRLLTLDYELVDAAGRRYTPKDHTAASPRFTILKNGQTIGSGSFEYG